MINSIIWYIFIGVALNFLYDLAVNHTGNENRFTMTERFITTLIWPIMLLIFIYHFIKSMISGPY